MQKIIRHISIIYLAVIVILRMLAMPITLLDYNLNKRFIASTLCENRFRTEKQCAGHCFLNKQLNRSNDNPSGPEQRTGVKNLVIDFFEPIQKPLFSCLPLNPDFFTRDLLRDISNPPAGNIFHPPIL